MSTDGASSVLQLLKLRVETDAAVMGQIAAEEMFTLSGLLNRHRGRDSSSLKATLGKPALARSREEPARERRTLSDVSVHVAAHR